MSDEVSGGNTGAVATGDASGGASPAPQSQSTAYDASSAEQSTQDTGTSTDSTEREGFIPRARFDEVNARMAAAEQQAKAFEQWQWLNKAGADPQNVRQMFDWYGRYNGDAGEFIESTLQEALQNPVHGQSVRSRLGRMLSSLRPQQQQQPQQAQPEQPIPDIPIVNERNEPIGNLAEIVQRLLAKEVGPLKQDYESRQGEKQQAKEREERQAHAFSIADADVAYVQKRPFFAQHKAEILETFRANPTMSLREAADHVLDTKVLPGYGQKAQAQVLSDLQLKANAQTVTPGMPTGTAKPKFKSFEDAHAYYAEHPEEAERMANR